MSNTAKRPVGDVTADMLSASSVEDVWQLFCDATVTYRFDRVLYCGSRFPYQGFGYQCYHRY